MRFTSASSPKALEPIITDIEAKSIIDDVIVPAFKQSDYGPGIYNGVAAIANIIYKETESGASPVAYEKIAAPKKPFVDTWAFPFIIIFANVAPWLAIGLVVFSAFIRSYIRDAQMPKMQKNRPYYYKKMADYADIYILWQAGSYKYLQIL